MEIVHTLRDLRLRLAGEGLVGLVPTMGSLHEGHLALVREARSQASCVVTSIFVNRLQFGPSEDFDRYPRDLEADTQRLAAAGCQVVFAPLESEMYPQPQRYFVEPPALQNELEGAVRPGHFKGVCTVVLKLFHMVQPQLAIFGKKDYQQWTLLREMVESLALPIRMIPGETIRAEDGLALSSRNAYLSPSERAEAPQLQRALKRIAQAIPNSDFSEIAMLIEQEHKVLEERGWKVDYLTLRSQQALAEARPEDRNLVLLAAARLGTTRLLDNLECDRAIQGNQAVHSGIGVS
jgi:pantoate--beta-alanine ligase